VKKEYEDVRLALKYFKKKMTESYRRYGNENQVALSLEKPFSKGLRC
jgi:hypothetical protein